MSSMPFKEGLYFRKETDQNSLFSSYSVCFTVLLTYRLWESFCLTTWKRGMATINTLILLINRYFGKKKIFCNIFLIIIRNLWTKKEFFFAIIEFFFFWRKQNFWRALMSLGGIFFVLSSYKSRSNNMSNSGRTKMLLKVSLSVTDCHWVSLIATKCH